MVEYDPPACTIVIFYHLWGCAGECLTHCIGDIPHRQTAAAAAQVFIKGGLQAGDPLPLAIQVADEMHRCLIGGDPILYLEYLHPRRKDLRGGHIDHKGAESCQRMGGRFPILGRQHRIQGTGSLGRGLYRCDIMGTGTGERMQVAVIDLPSALIHLQQPAALPAGCRRIIRRLREYKNSQDHRYKKKDQGDKYPCTPPLHLASPPYNIVLG